MNRLRGLAARNRPRSYFLRPRKSWFSTGALDLFWAAISMLAVGAAAAVAAFIVKALERGLGIREGCLLS